LAGLGWVSSGPAVPILGGLLGVGYAVVGRLTAWLSDTPRGVALTGAFWATFLNPIGCGLAGPLMVLTLAEANQPWRWQGPGGPPVMPNQELLIMATGYGVFFLLFAAGGAVVNVLIYRYRRRKLHQAVSYLATLERRTGEERAEPTGTVSGGPRNPAQ
jgi:hypothetical protein